MRLANFILVLGTLLITLRLFFPVLKCDPAYRRYYGTCNGPAIHFFSLQPRTGYLIYTNRTYMEAVGIGIFTVGLYVALRSKRKDQ